MSVDTDPMASMQREVNRLRETHGSESLPSYPTGYITSVVMPAVAADPVNHPQHYTRGGVEAIDVIEAWQLGFCLGNALKYIARADHKGSAVEDLKKARWYLDREIARRERP